MLALTPRLWRARKGQQAKEESTKRVTTQAAWEITIHNNACSLFRMVAYPQEHLSLPILWQAVNRNKMTAVQLGIQILDTPGMTDIQLGNKRNGAMWYAFPNFLAKRLTCFCIRKNMIVALMYVFCVTELLTGQILLGRSFSDFYSGDAGFESRPDTSCRN
jgi:hypothetical protein